MRRAKHSMRVLLFTTLDEMIKVDSREPFGPVTVSIPRSSSQSSWRISPLMLQATPLALATEQWNLTGG